MDASDMAGLLDEMAFRPPAGLLPEWWGGSGFLGMSPHELAAMRQRQSAQPMMGRKEGAGTQFIEDVMLPKTPLDAALFAVGGVPGRAAKAATLAAGAALSSDDAEAGPLRAARRILPMDEASRMRRATEQGFNIDAYKGQNPHYWDSLPETDGMGRVIAGTENRVPREIAEGKGGGFYSSDPAVASRFAEALTKEGAVFPSKLRFDNPLVIDAKGKPAAAFQFNSIAREHNTVEEMAALKSAFENGYDGVILRNTRDEGDVFVPRDGAQVRSRFAAFDPANKDKNWLLGSLAAFGLPSVFASEMNQR
jgi:hypothetical protein